jgi:triacylglycerol lipase
MTNYNFQADIKKFDYKTTIYNGENALLLADCAKLAYKEKESIEQVIRDQLQFNNFEFFDNNGTQAFIAGNDNMIIIAFRGTEMKVKDFLADAKLKLEPGPKGKVHRGFHGALHEVWGESLGDKDMRQCIEKFQDKQQSIWFCGHSLGAALATLAAAEYVLTDKKTANGVYTIGQPRVGNFTFASAFDVELAKQCFRFVNNNDVVTRIPLPSPILQYTHVGRQLYINSDGILQASIPFWKKVWDQWRGIVDDFGDIGFDALADHSSEDYVSLIKDNRSVTI